MVCMKNIIFFIKIKDLFQYAPTLNNDTKRYNIKGQDNNNYNV